MFSNSTWRFSGECSIFSKCNVGYLPNSKIHLSLKSPPEFFGCGLPQIRAEGYVAIYNAFCFTQTFRWKKSGVLLAPRRVEVILCVSDCVVGWWKKKKHRKNCRLDSQVQKKVEILEIPLENPSWHKPTGKFKWIFTFFSPDMSAPFRMDLLP